MSAAFCRVRFKTWRGSANEGVPLGRVMSQNIFAAPGACVRQGRIVKVAASGFANISDSVTRANPSMEEPSKPIPSANALSSSAGAIATDFK